MYNSAPSKTSLSIDGAKEPILLSGQFRSADRPGVDQQFEDDGYGNLRTFYNTGTRKVYTNTSAGTVNYDTGEIAFGPISVIGTGTNIATTGVTITDSTTGAGSVSDPAALPTSLSLLLSLSMQWSSDQALDMKVVEGLLRLGLPNGDAPGAAGY